MVPIPHWWVRAWLWVTGLRISTRAQRHADAERLEFAENYATRAWQETARAHAQTREANRLLVLLSEPLKDWDLADFPRTGQEGMKHLAAIQEGYRLVAGPVSHIRVGAKVGDRARRRGWDDEPLPVPEYTLYRNPRRNLP